ncbi:hypothetical protein [Kitasatospora sp. NPDC057015]|uniref:hypothetical protein n=1 Tax=Kitasatospora sp. NPDC057015 TaxID=3346001 RepID=UPI003643C1E7
MTTADDLSVRRAGLAIAEAVESLDRQKLKALGPDAFEAQFQAREALLEHVREIWDDLKARGLSPAVRSEYQPVAALLDILTALGEHAAHTERP